MADGGRWDRTGSCPQPYFASGGQCGKKKFPRSLSRAPDTLGTELSARREEGRIFLRCGGG